jgi:hypothetical protein
VGKAAAGAGQHSQAHVADHHSLVDRPDVVDDRNSAKAAFSYALEVIESRLPGDDEVASVTLQAAPRRLTIAAA